ncbi:hypothetical protein [Algibacter lectus]|uniref:hypothetical protein n=1 Tax=Algibacter lectus TaxID=221126 RepID=UPI0026F21607|nr:hypothetical protein [Algibacter lectus]MDO7138948.1 hypothetical protein [Algibacter lectus]
MKKAFFYIIIFLVFHSCEGQKLGRTLDLEDINTDFNIDGFYGDEIEMHKKYESQKDEIINGKKEEEFGDNLVKFWDFRHIRIDTVRYRNNEILNDPYRIIGITYDMTDWSDENTVPVARYRNLDFETINMMKSPRGKFIALFARNEDAKIKKAEFKKLLNHLVKEYGVPNVSEGSSYATKGYKYFQWNANKNFIYIGTKYNDKEHLNSIGINTSKFEFDTVKRNLIDVKLFIVHKKTKDSIMGRLNSNGWYHLK